MRSNSYSFDPNVQNTIANGRALPNGNPLYSLCEPSL
jgi:hypothetical protein